MDVNVIIFEFKENYYLAIDHALYNKEADSMPIILFPTLEAGYKYFLLSMAGGMGCNLGGLNYINTVLSSIVEYETAEILLDTLFPFRKLDNFDSAKIERFTINDDYVIGILIPDMNIGKSEWERGQHIRLSEETLTTLKENGILPIDDQDDRDSVLH